MKILDIQNVSISYNRKEVVGNISFTIKKGEFLSVLGENGSGKTSLIRAILKLKEINSGDINYLNGFTQTKIGYIAQNLSSENDFPASVREVVLSGFANKSFFRPFYNKKEKERAIENVKKLGIYDYYKKPFRELSGGQKQRVLLARALCAGNQLLVLDEPASALDKKTAQVFYETVKELSIAENMAVILISHDLKTAVNLADTILHLKNKEVFYGKSEDYKKSKYYKLLEGDE